MLKPVIDIIAKLKTRLFLLPAIVDNVKKKRISAVDHFTEWLRDTEDILQENGYAQCAELSGLRAKVVATSFVQFKTTSKKKEQLRVVADTIYPAQEVVSQLLIPMEAKLEEARLIIKQVLLIVQPSGSFTLDPSVTFNGFVQSIWHMLKSNEHVGGGISKVLTLLNEADALRILAEEVVINQAPHQ